MKLRIKGEGQNEGFGKTMEFYLFPTTTFHATFKKRFAHHVTLNFNPLQSNMITVGPFGAMLQGFGAETNDKGHMPSSTGCSLSFIPGFSDIGPDNLLLCQGRGPPCAL